MILSEAVTEADMEAVRLLRAEVFIDEQKVSPEEEWDGRDGDCRHLLVREGKRAVGTLRWRERNGTAKVERVCVALAFRGSHVGARLMKRVLDETRRSPEVTSVVLNAQMSVIGFYETLGFVAEGPVFDDAGIPHRRMALVLGDVDPDP